MNESLMAEWWAKEDMREGNGWRGGVGCNAPVQGVGAVDGLPWYFRARGDSWTFSVSPTPEGNPVDVWNGAPGFHVAENFGTDFAASWMSNDVAWGFIEQSIAAFRASLSSGQPITDPARLLPTHQEEPQTGWCEPLLSRLVRALVASDYWPPPKRRLLNLAHHIARSTPEAQMHIPITEMLDEHFEYLCRRCGMELLPPMTAAQAKKFVKKHGARACEAKK